MRPTLLCELLLIAGCLPPDEPPHKPAPPDPDIVQLVHAWKISDHVMATKTSLSDRDATELRGRTVTIGAASYTSPWHGTCDEANREKRTRALGDVIKDADLPATAHASLKTFGLADSVFEFKLSCHAHRTRTPALTIYVRDGRAMTCFGGACYLLEK